MSSTEGTSTAAPYDWREDGECSRKLDREPVYNPERWWPIGTGPEAMKQAREAQEVCYDLCPVRLDCLRHALDQGITEGIWGGHTELERGEMTKQLKAQRRRQRRQQEATASTRAAYVPARPTREVLQKAQAAGYGIRDISRATNITEAVIRDVLAGQARVAAGTQEKALAASFYRIGANA